MHRFFLSKMCCRNQGKLKSYLKMQIFSHIITVQSSLTNNCHLVFLYTLKATSKPTPCPGR